MPHALSPKALSALPASEERVMLALWACGSPCAFAVLQEALAGEHWAPSTLLNFLYRLEKRGFLQIEKQGGRNRYRALVEKRPYCLAQARQLLGRLYGGQLTGLVAELCRGRAVSFEEMEQLRELLDRQLIALYSDGSDLYDPWEG